MKASWIVMFFGVVFFGFFSVACSDGDDDDDSSDPSPSGVDEDGDGSDAVVDCDDEDPEIHPGADEVCDGIDNDCDGDEDEDVQSTYYIDVDGDGFGGVQTQQGCAPPPGYVTTPGDCDDTDANISPGTDEVCDELDNDCDGDVDEGFETDADGDGHPDCLDDDADGDGVTPAEGDCNDLNAAVYPGALEVCDGQDNDCDLTADEGFDRDVDGYKDSSCPGDDLDCDDLDASIHPDAAEVCDGVDNDCDGAIDESYDLDGDGYIADCNPVIEPGEDCDDSVAYVHPGAAERCNELDDDCDGLTDDDDPGVTDQDTWYPDADSDGYGLTAGPTVKACTRPAGYVFYGGDCDDADPDVNPGEVEVCDGVDNDCSDVVDDVDADGDGFYDETCATGPETASDCNDADPAIHPGATDPAGDGIDQDCDGADARLEDGDPGAGPDPRDADVESTPPSGPTVTPTPPGTGP